MASLATGSRLGPYEIVAAAGAGGMGEVYKARDTRLDRTVAIKILPSHLAADPELQKRFEQETRAVSGLSHPHICTLHDIGREDGFDFMVMEFLAGETLAERLKGRALPLAQALLYARPGNGGCASSMGRRAPGTRAPLVRTTLVRRAFPSEPATSENREAPAVFPTSRRRRRGTGAGKATCCFSPRRTRTGPATTSATRSQVDGETKQQANKERAAWGAS